MSTASSPFVGLLSYSRKALHGQSHGRRRNESEHGTNTKAGRSVIVVVGGSRSRLFGCLVFRGIGDIVGGRGRGRSRLISRGGDLGRAFGAVDVAEAGELAGDYVVKVSISAYTVYSD